MDDFDEVDEQNEEDLMLLGDSFGNIPDLKQHILTKFSEFADNSVNKQGKEYLQYCINQLHEED